MVAADTSGSTSQSFTCSTCQATFTDRPSQRAHFKSDWHVTNLKRRIESLEPVAPFSDDGSTSENHNTSDVKSTSRDLGSKHDPSTSVSVHGWVEREGLITEDEQLSYLFTHATSEDTSSATNIGSAVSDAFDPSLCLFCLERSSTLPANLMHMQQVHKFTIPNQDSLIDLESFMNYLFALVLKFHECIYCGITKPTSNAVQQHMTMKGHCLIGDIDEESDYCDFYDLSTREVEDDIGDRTIDMSESTSGSGSATRKNYVSLPSGKTLGNRMTTQNNDSRRRLPPRQHGKLVDRQEIRNADLSSPSAEDTDQSEAPAPPQFSIRKGDETGLTGVSDARRRALRATEKKDLRISIRARNRYQAGLEKMANNQKHFNEDSPGLGAHNTRY